MNRSNQLTIKITVTYPYIRYNRYYSFMSLLRAIDIVLMMMPPTGFGLPNTKEACNVR
jgi:hypothetical protein